MATRLKLLNDWNIGVLFLLIYFRLIISLYTCDNIRKPKGIEKEYWTEISLGCHIPLFQENLDIKKSLHLVCLFVEFVSYLLELHRVDYFLSDKLKQEPVGEQFGRIRSRGGESDNPTLEEYGCVNWKVIVAKSEMIQVTRGNARGRVRENTKVDIHDERQLAKQQKNN